MLELLIVSLSSVWLGVLTSISPCPLATNITAITFISKDIQAPRRAVFTSLFYSLGRSFVYVIISAAVVYSLINTPTLSYWLQKYMNMALGPILIVVGMFLLEMISFNFSQNFLNLNIEKIASKGGFLTAILIGIIFALSFCPVSAAIFFGSLLPISIKYHSVILLPFIYGFGTALPVIICGVMLAFGGNAISKFFNKMTSFESYARKITAVLFIVVGIYFTLKFTICVI